MRALTAKTLRKEALGEMMFDGVPKRDLVIDRRGTVVNSPSSIRALYLKLKAAYNRVARFAGDAVLAVRRSRKPGFSNTQQPSRRQVWIQNPLKFIGHHCPPQQNLRGEWEPHPVYLSAWRAAKAGRGDLVRKTAAQFAGA